MTTQIWKYQISAEEFQSIDVPAGYTILAVQVQYGRPHLWIQVNPEAPKVKVTLGVYGTGQDIPPIRQNYIGTVQLSSGSLVFHVFEVTKVGQ